MDGESNSSSMILVICVTVAVTGALVITAFARYQFTHLETDPRLTKKKKNRKHR